MNEKLRIRRLREAEAPLAAEAIRILKDAGDAHPAPRDAEAWRTWLGQNHNILLVSTLEGSPVGFGVGYLLERVDEERPMLFFYELEVAEAHRRCGIGTQLVEEMKAVAQAHKVRKLWVQTDPENGPANALYRKAGGIVEPRPEQLYLWTEPSSEGRECPPSLSCGDKG